MGNLCLKFTNKNNYNNVVLLLLGLDNAGKTVIAKRLAKEDFTSVMPTIGFSMINLTFDKHTVMVYELGGSEQIRNIWTKYYLDAHGLIFVVDSNDSQRLVECQLILNEILSHKQINGKPILIFANKQDSEYALDEIDIVEKLQIEDMVNKYRCPALVQPCSAISSTDSNQNIENGYNWIVSYILKNYSTINNRVMNDMKDQQELDSKAKKVIKTKHTKIMNGCFGDSWIPRNLQEYPPTPKRTFLLNTLANSSNNINGRPGSCPVRESGSVKLSGPSRRVRSAVGFANEPRHYKKAHNVNKRPRSKYFIPSLCSFGCKNKVGVLE